MLERELDDVELLLLSEPTARWREQGVTHVSAADAAALRAGRPPVARTPLVEVEDD